MNTEQLSLNNNLFPHFAHSNPLDKETCKIFCEHIWDFYKKNRRDFVWRQTTNPYHIVVSEIMLQQTQTERVKEKFVQFIECLPTFQALADAPVAQVITLWQGLGYNRRALALQKIAQKVVNEYGGVLPNNSLILQTFPGLGPATAASICAFAFNVPTVFVETNIRAVYIYSFFHNRTEIPDKELIPLIQTTVSRDNAREWYYALMDYGVALKKTFKNPSRRSAHYTKQSKFEGSERQIRGMILKALTEHVMLSYDELYESIPRERERILRNVEQLRQEGFITEDNEKILLCR